MAPHRCGLPEGVALETATESGPGYSESEAGSRFLGAGSQMRRSPRTSPSEKAVAPGRSCSDRDHSHPPWKGSADSTCEETSYTRLHCGGMETCRREQLPSLYRSASSQTHHPHEASDVLSALNRSTCGEKSSGKYPFPEGTTYDEGGEWGTVGPSHTPSSFHFS